MKPFQILLIVLFLITSVNVNAEVKNMFDMVVGQTTKSNYRGYEWGSDIRDRFGNGKNAEEIDTQADHIRHLVYRERMGEDLLWTKEFLFVHGKLARLVFTFGTDNSDKIKGTYGFWEMHKQLLQNDLGVKPVIKNVVSGTEFSPDALMRGMDYYAASFFSEDSLATMMLANDAVLKQHHINSVNKYALVLMMQDPYLEATFNPFTK